MKKNSSFFEHAIGIVIVAMLIGMILLVFTNVILRYVFNSGISVSVEISRFLFVWITFLGIILVTLKEKHLSVDMLIERLPSRCATYLKTLVYLVMILCCIIILIGSYKQVIINWNSLSPISKLPIGLFYLAAFFSSLSMIPILAKQIYKLYCPQENKEK